MTSPRQRAAQRQIKAFHQKFGDAHLYFSYHAAFPLALTPELLYQLWANFQTDQTGTVLNIPWITVADLLLSGLCREVGHELYEMDATVRTELLSQLQSEPRFGLPRIQQLATFMLAYIRHQLRSPDPDIREVASTQRWIALVYVRPGTAARELIITLAKLRLNQSAEWLRVTSLIDTLADPLAEFQPLLAYASGMKSFFRGQMQDATVQLQTLSESGQIFLSGIELPLPEQIRRNVVTDSQPLASQSLVSNTESLESRLSASGDQEAALAPVVTLYLKLTSNDIVKAQSFHVRKSIPFLLKLLIVVFLLALGMIFLSAVIGFLASGDPDSLGIVFPVLCLIYFFYYRFFIYSPRRIRRDFRRYRIMQIGSDLAISPDVVEVTSEIAMKRYQIADCYMYRANSDFILLYLAMPTINSLALCIILPRRCFNSNDDFQQVLTYFKAVFGKPGKPLKRDSLSPRSLPYQAHSSFKSTISLRVQLTPKDYLKSNYLHLRPGPVRKRVYIALFVIYLILTIFTGYSAIVFGSNASNFILLLLLGAFGIYFYFIQLPLAVRRLSKQNAYLLFEHQVEISSEMLEVVEVTGTIRMRLVDFVKYKFDKELIVLYVTDRAFRMFPRRCFKSESDFQTFLTYLQNNLGAPQS
ncbi:MAG: YcxB family protein [Leptolyngbyaceae cyanobacterium]